MIKINLVAVGKVKEDYFSLGINEYVKRLSRFCSFKLIEVEEENYKNPDASKIKDILEKEADRIIDKLSGYVIATAIEGKKLSSVALSEKIEKLKTQGKGVITFVIGGSYGLSERVKSLANEMISFSDMTFPHTLFRLMAVEQIYRAMTIAEGVLYHK